MYPPFAELLSHFEAQLAMKGLPFYLFEGYRSPERQLELWHQGRSTPGPIVTNALPFSSFHHYGFAADYVLDGMLDRPGVQWSWDVRNDNAPLWREMADTALQCGLTSGFYWADFPDLPHVQKNYGFTISRLRSLIQINDLPAIWKMADEWLEQQLRP